MTAPKFILNMCNIYFLSSLLLFRQLIFFALWSFEIRRYRNNFIIIIIIIIIIIVIINQSVTKTEPLGFSQQEYWSQLI